MVLSDRAIQDAIDKRLLIIDPAPPPEHYSPTAVDLRLGHDFKAWNSVLIQSKGSRLDFDKVQTSHLAGLATTPDLEADGSFVLRPRDFVLAQTLEKVAFPIASQLAGRVEGRSRLARLGVAVHLTAPTIHADFGGESGAPITLEVVNMGPFEIVLRPGSSRICQLIVERVEGEIGTGLASEYRRQDNPLGGRKSR